MPINPAGLPDETAKLLRDRYGFKQRSRWRVLAILITAIALPWLLWSAWFHSNPAIRTSTIKYATIDDRKISLSFELTRRSGQSELVCTLIAEDIERNVVGELDLRVAAAAKPEKRIEILTVEIPTRLRAVHAKVERCSEAIDADQ